VVRDRTTPKARVGMLAGAAVVAALAFPGIASATVTSTVTGGALTATSNANDAIAITCVAGKVKVNGADPGAATDCSALTSVSVTGGPGANLIDLSAINPTDFPALTSVTANGGDGDDTIKGTQFADRLSGGDGNDTITPDDNPINTRDDARGDAGNDTIIWNGGDDDDLNDGGDGNDTTQVNGAPVNEAFTVKPGPNGHVIFDRLTTPPGPFNIDISTTERLDLNMNGGDDTVTADPGFSALALDVDGGDGNDNIDGSDAADRLSGGNGDDRIVPDDNPAGTRDVANGDAGNDTMVWNPGDDDDVNEGGDGDDTSEVNGAGGDEDFTVKPSATAGRVAFDRINNPFNVDIGTTEHLRVNAGGGDDTIKGSKGLAGLIESELSGDDGDDAIRGTDGEDRLNGGKGLDFIRSRDKAEDLVDCGTGFDLAIVDRRDFLRGCDIVLGGALRVRVPDRMLVADHGRVAVSLKCAGTKRCKGVLRLRNHGKTLAAKRFNIKHGSKTVHLNLNHKGLRLLAGAPSKGRSMKLQIDAKDAKGNGWRSTARVTVTP
jgi:Ca2+-binding RTX toxin-like protein